LRPVLAAEGIAVHGVYPGGIDTDMLAGIDAPKTAPSEVAAGLRDGLEASEEDIFPDPNARAMSELWRADPKEFERTFTVARLSATEEDTDGRPGLGHLPSSVPAVCESRAV
jgi:NAD(P)-dependent dehydrogenase (short-subunit alcohol dehydrogenase family)